MLGILSTVVLVVPIGCSKGLAEAPLVPAQTKGELKPSSHYDTACIGILRRADISSSRQYKERRESAHDAVRGCVNTLALPLVDNDPDSQPKFAFSLNSYQLTLKSEEIISPILYLLNRNYISLQYCQSVKIT